MAYQDVSSAQHFYSTHPTGPTVLFPSSSAGAPHTYGLDSNTA